MLQVGLAPRRVYAFFQDSDNELMSPAFRLFLRNIGFLSFTCDPSFPHDRFLILSS